MCIEEFSSVFSDLGLITETFTERDVLVAYVQSMMTQTDEISSLRHMKMQFLEFLEAVARCADMLSMRRPGSPVEDVSDPSKQHLVCKIESLLFVLIKLGNKDFITKYKWPMRGMWNLFNVSRSKLVNRLSNRQEEGYGGRCIIMMYA